MSINDKVYFGTMLFLTVASTLGSLIFSTLYNLKMENRTLKKMPRKRKASKELLKREKYIMKEATNGRIKCNIIRNSAPPFDNDKWVEEMERFIEKPIFKQVMNLEGHDI